MKKGKVLSWVWLFSVFCASAYYLVTHGGVEELLVTFAVSMALGVTLVSLVEVLSDD